MLDLCQRSGIVGPLERLASSFGLYVSDQVSNGRDLTKFLGFTAAEAVVDESDSEYLLLSRGDDIFCLYRTMLATSAYLGSYRDMSESKIPRAVRLRILSAVQGTYSARHAMRVKRLLGL